MLVINVLTKDQTNAAKEALNKPYLGLAEKFAALRDCYNIELVVEPMLLKSLSLETIAYLNSQKQPGQTSEMSTPPLPQPPFGYPSGQKLQFEPHPEFSTYGHPGTPHRVWGTAQMSPIALDVLRFRGPVELFTVDVLHFYEFVFGSLEKAQPTYFTMNEMVTNPPEDRFVNGNFFKNLPVMRPHQ